MQECIGRGARVLAAAVIACAIGACSSDLGLNNVTLAPKAETLPRKPDWATFSGNKSEFELRPVTASDLVSADGQCVPAAHELSSSDRAPSLIGGGIALQMTECDVVRRAGPVEKFEIGLDERGDRAVMLTYQLGPLPGIYRFAGGRLVSIERGPAPPPAPAKPQKATKPVKKPAGT
jgi:hypothetical protein